MTPEGKVKAKIRAVLKRRGIQYIMPVGTAYSASGISDYILNVGGIFAAVEAKTSTGKLTALQSKFLADTTRHNGATFIVYGEGSIAAFEAWLDQLQGAP